jgi:hypothetical protein
MAIFWMTGVSILISGGGAAFPMLNRKGKVIKPRKMINPGMILSAL